MQTKLQVTVNDYVAQLPYDEGMLMKITEVGEYTLVVKSDMIGLELEFTPEHHLVTATLPAYQWDSRVEGLCGK